MAIQNQFEPGDYVNFTYPHGEVQNGRIKTLGKVSAFVVFHCEDNWQHYQEYTGQLCDLKFLKSGWIKDANTSP